MISEALVDNLSSAYGRDPSPRNQLPECAELDLDCIAWRFPYEEKMDALDLGARDREMNERLAQAREFIEDQSLRAYKGGDFMWVNSDLSIADEIIILDTTDQFDILKFECTQGNNHPISTTGLIESLREFDRALGIDIVGASNGAVEFRFKSSPDRDEAEAIVSAIREICPDTMDDFRGLESKRVVLYWD